MAHFFCIFHALSFELTFFRPEFPFKSDWGEMYSAIKINYF